MPSVTATRSNHRTGGDYKNIQQGDEYTAGCVKNIDDERFEIHGSMAPR